VTVGKRAGTVRQSGQSKSRAAGRSGEQAGLAASIRAYATKNEEPAHEIRFARCTCGGERFRVHTDDSEGVAQRTCAACGTEHLLCDSAEFWDDASPEACMCTCERDLFRLAVGFSIQDNAARDVRWIYIGLRCEHCGVQGVYADWSVDYSPSHQLMDQV
jgi:hypothetical protein